MRIRSTFDLEKGGQKIKTSFIKLSQDCEKLRWRKRAKKDKEFSVAPISNFVTNDTHFFFLQSRVFLGTDLTDYSAHVYLSGLNVHRGITMTSQTLRQYQFTIGALAVSLAKHDKNVLSFPVFLFAQNLFFR